VALREGEEPAALEALERWLNENPGPRAGVTGSSGGQLSLFGEEEPNGKSGLTVGCPLRAVELVVDLARVACEAGADPSAAAAVGLEVAHLLTERPGGETREPFATLRAGSLREAVRQWAALVRAGSPQSERIRRAVAYLHAHYTDPDLKEEKVAQEALLCLSHFWRAFRAEMGVTYARYLRNLRVEEGKRLLASTSLSVEEIARQVGYEAPEAFCRAFKQGVGVSPSQYRRQLKGKAGSP